MGTAAQNSQTQNVGTWVVSTASLALFGATAGVMVLDNPTSSSTVATADAGANQTIQWPQNRARLTGRLPAGTPIWAYIGKEPGVLIVTPNSFTTDVIFPKPGVYTFELRTKGTRSSTSWDRVTVTVKPGGAIDVTVTTATPTAISLRWTQVPNAVDYRISRNGIQLAIVEDSQVRFREIDLVPSTAYSYVIEALDAEGQSIGRGVTDATTQGGAPEFVMADLPPGDVIRSRAMVQFGWTPDPVYDTCSKELHDAFWVFGPDNKAYPTWHPPVYEFANGQTCRFGHEHGQDQRESTLFRTVGPFAFGYVNEQLAPNDPSRQRNEDHVGHKVALFNRLPAYDNVSGEDTYCDVFFKLHQGSHSPDAFRNPSHERFLNYSCTNGLEMRWKSLQSFGQPNTFTQQVNNELERTEVVTEGAFPTDQPIGADRRAIMSALTFSYTTRPGGRGLDKTENDPNGVSDCDNCKGTDGFPAYLPIWNFESWQGGPGTRLMTDQSPTARTSLFFAGGPYWNVANSARYYDPDGDSNPANNATYRLGRQLDFCFRSDAGAYPSLDCQVARLRAMAGSFGWNSPKSPFTGSIRFNEFNFVDLENYDPRNRRLFTDPYGDFKAFSSDVNFVTRTRSAEMPIRQFLGVTTRRLSVVADNWAGSKSCGSRECWTDFRWYKLKNGTWVDTQVHAPN